MIAQPDPIQELIYPDSDGQPMSDNTEQFRWIVIIKENLEILYVCDPGVFIAGDLLWYPVQGSLECVGPDVMVAFGRPKGQQRRPISGLNRRRRGLEMSNNKINVCESNCDPLDSIRMQLKHCLSNQESDPSLLIR